MNDDELRAALRASHTDDRPPSFAALIARRRRRAGVFGAPFAAAVAVAALFLLCRREPDLSIPEWHDPFGGLLQQSRPNVYSDLPTFKGDWP
jgi:hypothetical protein